MTSILIKDTTKEQREQIVAESIGAIEGGMTKQMIYHGEHGWSYEG